ncbi:MAG: transposase [Verrucomicrobia bacterium]|nr:transposase [Verrucomicrobiota bacterium]
MLRTIDIEVFLSCAYTVFLVLVAFSLELAARYSHHQSKQVRLAGFRYHRHIDLWECPTGQHLWPVASDHSRHVYRYRAHAHVCNACSIKDLCTDSDRGRELEHNPNSWLESEVQRFHRGISLSILVLAVSLLIVEMIRHQRPIDLLVLSGCLGAVAVFATRLFAVYFARWIGK